MSFLFVDGHAFTLEADLFPVFRLRRNGYGNLAVKGRDFEFSTENSRIQAHFSGGIKIAADALEIGVFQYSERDVKISFLASVAAGPALAFDADSLPVFYPRGNDKAYLIAIDGEDLFLILVHIPQPQPQFRLAVLTPERHVPGPASSKAAKGRFITKHRAEKVRKVTGITEAL